MTEPGLIISEGIDNLQATHNRPPIPSRGFHVSWRSEMDASRSTHSNEDCPDRPPSPSLWCFYLT
jgi:hypothetical protein